MAYFIAFALCAAAFVLFWINTSKGHYLTIWRDPATGYRWSLTEIYDPGEPIIFNPPGVGLKIYYGNKYYESLSVGGPFGFVYYYRPPFTPRHATRTYTRPAELIVQVPHWYFILILGGLSFLCWRKYRTLQRIAVMRDRLARGLCPTCCYDLRAHIAPSSAAGDNCPECGARIPAPSALEKPQHAQMRTGRRISPLAISSLAFDLLALITCLPPFNFLVFGTVAIVLGHKAKAEIRRDPEHIKGRRLAIAGLTLGYVFLVPTLIFEFLHML